VLASGEIITPAKSNRKIKVEVIILTLVLAAIAFIANPNGHPGTFWGPSIDSMQPTN
jgi:hypothetical protein